MIISQQSPEKNSSSFNNTPIKTDDKDPKISVPSLSEQEVEKQLKDSQALDFPKTTEKPKQTLLEYYKSEILVGIIVGFVLVPQECAYSLIGNLDPSLGTHSAWIAGLVCAVFGGRPAMINGLTGGLSSVIAGSVSKNKGKNGSGQGVEELFLSTIIAGVIIAIVGLLRLGKFQNMIPATVKVGFCNGLAIIIGITFFFYFSFILTMKHFRTKIN